MHEELEALLESARDAQRAGTWDEAIERYEQVLARVHREGDPRCAAETLRAIGQVRFERGALEEAWEVFEASLAIAEANEMPEHLASALNCLAVVEQFLGRTPAAEERYLRARDIAEALGDARRLAMIDQNLGTLANIRGDRGTAEERFRRAIGAFLALGDELGAARTLNNLGMAQVDAREWHAAEASFDRAFALADGAQELATLGSIEINRGELYLLRGDAAAAREHCDRAFEIFGRLGSKTGLGETHKLNGLLHRETGKPYLAEMHLLLALELARASQDRLLEAEVERERALLATAQGNDPEALDCLGRAHELFTELEAGREVLDIERRRARLEGAYLQLVTRWSASVDSLDRHEAGHSARVAELACRVAREVGMCEPDLTALRIAALLHDLGKTALPDEVVHKSGPLSPRELQLVRSHPALGARLVADRGLPWGVAPIVHSHQEHWDGTGFPDGLRGEEIPLPARILRVADAFDTLSGPRIYRPALQPAEALRVMEREAGTVVDPRLFEVLHRTLGKGGPGEEG